MRHTPFTPLAETFAATIFVTGFLFLAACSATPASVAHSDPATLTPTLEITFTSTSERDESVESVSPTPEPVTTQPAAAHTIPATPPVVESAPPSLTLAAEPSPTLAEAMSAQPAPDFTLEGAQDEAVTLSDYRDRANVVLVFYQGKT